MKKFEVITVQQYGAKGRVVHKDFDSFEDALKHANEICEDIRTIRCSIYRLSDNEMFLVFDVL